MEIGSMAVVTEVAEGVMVAVATTAEKAVAGTEAVAVVAVVKAGGVVATPATSLLMLVTSVAGMSQSLLIPRSS